MQMDWKWSVYFQTPDFLERTRLMLIDPEFEPMVAKWCGLKSGSKVLDVGCGTGFLARMLKRMNPEASLTGLDREPDFLARGREEAKNEGHSIEFVEGDALDMPFEDNSFDLVVSHTFMTSAPDPGKAISEMKRVLRPGGRISSITAMGFIPHAMSLGEYPPELPWGKEVQVLGDELWTICCKLAPFQLYVNRLSPAEIPAFFAKNGLKQVCAYPIGKIFSLSNAAIPKERKLKWLDLYKKSEEGKMRAFLAVPEGREVMDPEKVERYIELLEKKCEYYRTHLDENAIWEWQGGSNLMVTGDL